jgi:spore maturation protein CgeB
VKILCGYHYYPSSPYGDIEQLELAYYGRLRQAGFDVEGFCLTMNAPAPCLTFSELDRRWRRRDRVLLELYEGLASALEGKDVFINMTGVNVHPDFVRQLSVFTVFQCFDDPENSWNLSRPVADAYDLCMVGNVAEIDTYKRWGVQNVEWRPLGLYNNFYDSSVTYESLLSGSRDIDIFMMCDRFSPWRKARVDQLYRAFPDAHFYGKGWPRGYVKDEVGFLRRARIGPNIHNSTGPLNSRTYYLPANGVLQVCDNKQHLDKIFRIGHEVVGFETMKECIDLCNYYMAHEAERRQIAANGWLRATSEYSENAVFQKLVNRIGEYMERKRAQPAGVTSTGNLISLQRMSRNRFFALVSQLHGFATRLARVLRKLF